MINLHSAVLEWLSGAVDLFHSAGELGFNFVPVESGGGGVVTTPSAPFVKRFLRGGVKQYLFDLVLFAPAAYDVSDASENVECMELVQGAILWIGEQNDMKNFPDFGKFTPVVEVGCMTDSPRVKQADKTGGVSYSVPVRILYLDRGATNPNQFCRYMGQESCGVEDLVLRGKY